MDHAWNEKKEPCPICLQSNWDDIHALFGCSGMVNDETVKKIIDEFGDLCGKSIHTQSSFIEALQEFIKVGYNEEKTLGNIFIKLKQQWVNNKIQGGSPVG